MKVMPFRVLPFLLILGLFFLPEVIGQALPLFQTRIVLHPWAGSPSFVSVEDFDSDGCLDMAILYYGKVFVLLGNGDGTYASPMFYAVGAGSSAQTTGDFDGDGVLDLAVTNYDEDNVSVLLGNGDGSFQPQVTYAVGAWTPHWIGAEDLNGDGSQDIVVDLCPWAHSYSVLLGNGDGTFKPAVNYELDGNAVEIGDLDKDGVPDLVVLRSLGAFTYGKLCVFLGNGDGSFRTTVEYEVGKCPWDAVVSDIDGDGNPDVVLANGCGEGEEVSVLLGNGDGALQSAAQYAAGARCESVAVADLNGDGVPDISTANFLSHDASVLLGNGDGTFKPSSQYATGFGPRLVVAADMNGDGNPDLVVNDSSTSVLLGNGDGTFPQPANFSVGDTAQAVAVHDLNGDEVLDLVSVNYLGDDISVLLGNGDGTFPQGTNYPVGHRPNEVAVGDLDGNGSPDLAVSNYWYGDISVLLGKGKGLFNPAFNLPAGTTSTLSVAIGDLDGNGFLDLVAANWGGNVSVLLGNGDGTFQPYSQFRAGDQSSSVAIGDLNGDGVQDLAVAGSIPESSTVSILLGNGDGTFDSPWPYPVARPGAISVAVGDLDGDEVLDLAVAGGYLDSSLPPSALGGVSVLLGNGDGTFQPAVGYDCGVSPHEVAIGDLDGDGIKDLAVTNYITHAISVLLGHGDGSFQSAVNYGMRQGSLSVAIGDLDRDGAMDLAAVTSTSEVGTYQVTILSQKAIRCPDLDGDGYGDPGTTLCPFAAYDCDDFDPSIHPNAPETNGDGLDSNCNGMENCFIATAAFESTLDPKLDLLRALRDRYLMSNGLGESFVEIYYTYSPHVAGVIAEHPWLRCLVRILMLPLIGFVSLLV